MVNNAGSGRGDDNLPNQDDDMPFLVQLARSGAPDYRFLVSTDEVGRMSSTHGELQPYAVRSEESRGRCFAEPEHPYRDPFDRDRDRVVHSRAFRRLEYKTQVFPNHHGDHFRTRLTHTIEVAQLARTVARVLGLNTALSEAIALAHDLGHPPFGHVGEGVLDTMMRDTGGFEHNRHTLRTVVEIEERYAGFRGLNLTYEVREGIAKHSARYDRFDGEEMAEFRPHERPPLEAQIIDLVDDLAYNVHDIDDGVEAHVLSIDELVEDAPIFGRIYRRMSAEFSGASRRELFNETIRRMVDSLVTDLIQSSREAIAVSGVRDLVEIRALPTNLACHSEEVRAEMVVLGELLSQRLYQSPLVHEQMESARLTIERLFQAYVEDPELLPERHRQRAARVGTRIAIGDYVAGMTDRFVIREHDRLVGVG